MESKSSEAVSSPLTMTKKVGARIPTENGEFTVYLYHSSRDPQKEHMAFVYGDVKSLVILFFFPLLTQPLPLISGI
jgi:hypothetical protein